MRFFLFTPSLILFSALTLQAIPVGAQESEPHEPPFFAEPITPEPEALRPQIDDVPQQSETTRTEAEKRIETLFALLKKTRNPRAAQNIANDIWSQWFKSGSASIDLLLQWSGEAVQRQQYNIALDFLDQVILLKPDYAEGWNRRATLHYTMLNFNKSMTDVRKVLELEPRHFGALSGLATMLERNGNDQAALKVWQQLLTVYPAMPSAQEAVMRLSEKLEGDPA